jgi:hypothetical protein
MHGAESLRCCEEGLLPTPVRVKPVFDEGSALRWLDHQAKLAELDGDRSASKRSRVPAPSGTHGEQALLLPGHSTERRLKVDDPHQEGMRIPVRCVYLVVALPPDDDTPTALPRILALALIRGGG